MQTTSQNPPQAHAETLDAETLAFAQKVFQFARLGAAEHLGPLLEQGLPANLCNHKGDSLLMLASYHGHFDTARLLLEYDADPEIRNDHGQTPLAGAAYKGDLAMARLLVEHGADVNGASEDGKTALMLAAMFDRTEIVELLLKHGADAKARDANGMNAHEAASRMGAPRTCARLAAYGA